MVVKYTAADMAEVCVYGTTNGEKFGRGTLT
jgi:hypothetical protein